ncbi:ABC transporter substrate-binding protein [Massilia sp.]|uniref:ABC transporter substrate-binding protein n=1 Tax=Massilia sp. TaxID=1882437 RepID=UPI00289B38BF|nr:ABC transporter substrate-binding protein [Massilia sp.]
MTIRIRPHVPPGAAGLARARSAVCALALAACPFTLHAEEVPIRIGLPVPLTGPYGAEAQDQVRNARLAIQEFNDAGGLNGRKAELLVRDDKLNPAEAATRALELIEKDRVDFIVGSLSAATQLAVNNVTRQRKVLYVSISQSDAINEAADFSRYTFHESLNPHMTTQAVGRHVFRKGMRVAFLTADYAYGHEMTRGFTRVARELGAVVAGEIRHPLGATDYSPFVPRLLAMRPDVVVFNNFGRDNQIAIKQVADFGLKRSMQFVTPVLTYTSRMAAGDRVYQDVIGGSSYHWSIEADTPSARALNTRYRQAYGGAPPSDYGAMAYSAVRSVLLAVRAAGSSDTEAVVDALTALRYDTYKGMQSYRACDHQSLQSVLVVKSKPAPRGSPDVFTVLGVAPASAAALRSCAELGHAS